MAPAVMRERALARLRASASYWLATTRPDGRPHAAPPDGGAWLYSLRVEAGHAWLEGAFEETRTRWRAAPD